MVCTSLHHTRRSPATKDWAHHTGETGRHLTDEADTGLNR